jgi:hypothetical protein
MGTPHERRSPVAPDHEYVETAPPRGEGEHGRRGPNGDVCRRRCIHGHRI